MPADPAARRRPVAARNVVGQRGLRLPYGDESSRKGMSHARFHGGRCHRLKPRPAVAGRGARRACPAPARRSGRSKDINRAIQQEQRLLNLRGARPDRQQPDPAGHRPAAESSPTPSPPPARTARGLDAASAGLDRLLLVTRCPQAGTCKALRAQARSSASVAGNAHDPAQRLGLRAGGHGRPS